MEPDAPVKKLEGLSPARLAEVEDFTAGVVAAVQTLAQRPRFVLGEPQWQAFQEALDRPVQCKPRLEKLLRGPGVEG